MVGVAISASFMPPLTNAGLNFILGLYHALGSHPKPDVPLGKGFEIAAYSVLLFVVNLVVIVMISLLVFWVKSVQPLRHKPLAGV